MAGAARVPRIRVVMMPKDTNAMGNIFGGVILSHLDLAAAEHAYAYAAKKVVTKVINGVDFIAPVKVGDTVSYYTETVKVGNSSITIKVEVEAERKALGSSRFIKVTEAVVVMVAVDDTGKAVPLK